MKRASVIYFLSLMGVLWLVACEDSLDFQLDDYQSKLVVDGWIEAGQHPVVVLTKSASYFSEIDSAALRNLVATRAKVTVSDGTREEVLTLVRNTQYFPPYIYQGTEIIGEAGKSYELSIELEGKTYRASTTIPPPVMLDSLWFGLAPDNDSLGFIYCRIQDDASTDNYYRIFTQRQGQDKKFIPIYLSTIGDQFFNGKKFTFSLLRSSESLSDVRDDIYFRKGDTVMVKIATLDRPHFDFWRTLERELYVTGNPFASSGNEIKSNVSGGALGVWGGYHPTIYRMVAR